MDTRASACYAFPAPAIDCPAVAYSCSNVGGVVTIFLSHSKIAGVHAGAPAFAEGVRGNAMSTSERDCPDR